MPSTATDRIDGLTTSAAIKAPCRVATTANITLSGLQTIDGVTVVADDRVLVKNQTDTTANGIYVADTSSWSRARDFDGSRDVATGTIVTVNSGTVNAGTYWRLTTSGTVSFGTSAITFASALASSGAGVSFTADITGAVSRSLQDKGRDFVTVADAGISASASDQTSAVGAVLAALTTSWEGTISAPIGVRMDLQTVINAIPDKATMSGVTVFQTGSGYRQQIIWDADNPPDANTDTARMIASTHYPDLMLNNLRTAGTTSATNGLSGFSWARGLYRNGSKGPRVQWQANFTKSSVRTTEYTNNGVGAFLMRTRSPERAGNYEEWSNGMTITSGDYIVATNGYFYRATTSGTSTASPTHTSGSATTGGITWAFESSFVPFGTVFYVDELARVGNTPCDTGITQHWKQNSEDSENFVVRYDAGGASKTIEWRLRPTDSGSSLVAIPYLQASSSVGLRALDSAGTRVLYTLTDARGFQLGTHGLVQATAADLDTTPTVAAGGCLTISNTGATSITDFDNYLPDQRVELYFTTANTTLVNSATLVLKGAANATPAADQIITIRRNPGNTAWVEVSRNY